jgi:hypothetical protein
MPELDSLTLQAIGIVVIHAAFRRIPWYGSGHDQISSEFIEVKRVRRAILNSWILIIGKSVSALLDVP